LESFICSENYLTDFGAENTCCETDGCDSYNRSTVFSLSFSQDLYPLQKVESIFDAGNGGQTKLKPDTLLISFKAAPIYILTQSIIC